jgi:hypothetical protein
MVFPKGPSSVFPETAGEEEPALADDPFPQDTKNTTMIHARAILIILSIFILPSP